MIDPTKIDINKVPKEFCDGAFIGHNKALFFLVLTNADTEYGFCTTPEQMKLTQIMINTNMALWEKSYGVLDPEKILKLNEPIISPIQMDSLGGDKGGLKDGE